MRIKHYLVLVFQTAYTLNISPTHLAFTQPI